MRILIHQLGFNSFLLLNSDFALKQLATELIKAVGSQLWLPTHDIAFTGTECGSPHDLNAAIECWGARYVCLVLVAQRAASVRLDHGRGGILARFTFVAFAHSLLLSPNEAVRSNAEITWVQWVHVEQRFSRISLVPPNLET